MKRIMKIAVIVFVLTFCALPVFAEDGIDEVIFTPKVLVESYECISLEEDALEGVINAGDKIQVKITLINTSYTEQIQNMTVTATVPSDGFILLSKSDTQYIRYFNADSTIDVIFEYETQSDMPAGQYSIGISYDFSYGKGMSSAGSGRARVTVTQPLEMELSVMQIPGKAVISDTIEVGVQTINLSRAKAYNVRAVIEADGFLPRGSIFIGDLEGGMSALGTTSVTITGLTKGNFSYGQTEGTITFYYEDVAGNEFTEEKSFTTVIESPFTQQTREEEDKPGQWWVIMLVIAVVIAVFVVVFTVKWIKGRRKNELAE